MQCHPVAQSRPRVTRSLSDSLGALHASRHTGALPVPPTLVNSPHLLSPNSVFCKKSSIRRWPSRADDEWLRDMVPIGAEHSDDDDAASEPSSCTSDSSYSFPPSPILRPLPSPPDVYMTATHFPFPLQCTRYSQALCH
ncbi:hypothetical protein ID866_3212 [Astraeus odoratus]|nr:hypothetical protein ID866_3212 [Astraeus odoratus]